MTLDLLIAKLHALNFDMNALNLIFDYLTDYLIEEADIMSYADDNTLYMCSKNVDVTLEKLEEVGKAFFEWFPNNFLKATADKCHLILSTDESFSINIDNEVIKNSNNKKLLEINLYNELGFDTHVANICNRASKKLHALVRISQFMTQPAWDVSEGSQSDIHWERHISGTSQKHLKRDHFFVTSLRRLKYI